MKKEKIPLILIVGVLGIIGGSLISSPGASAGFLEDFKNLIERFSPPATSEVETEITPVPEPYSPPADYEERIIAAIEKASPSVVSIIVSKDLPIIEQCPYDPGLPPGFRDFFDPRDFTVPCERGTRKQEIGGGSGFVISSDGMVLTNRHVVSDTAADYVVLTNDGEKYDARVLARDPIQDLAVIKIEASGLRTAQLGDSRGLKLGQTAIAIGNALGEFRNTVSVGVISGLSRTITAGSSSGTEVLQDLIQTDAAINPGNSGGPLLNLKGEVIGINTAIAAGAENIGFAIPINQAKRDIQSVIKTGSIKVPYIGVRYILVNEGIMRELGLGVDYGALVRASANEVGVLPGSPADKAGLKTGDIILEINREKIDLNNPLSNLISKYNIGDTISLKVRRGDANLEIRVTLEERK